MDANLARLTRLVPPPAAGRNKDWEEVRRAVGADLPADYKEFIRTYAGSYWDDYLYVLEPGCPNRHYDLLALNAHAMEDLEGLWEYEERPPRLEEPGSRLIPWAVTDNGETAYWLARPGVPADRWTVMVNEDGDRWEHADTTCTGFLFAVLTGEIVCDLFSPHYFPLPEHRCRRLDGAGPAGMTPLSPDTA
ncbi:SMI1/KNR4 family protein [Nocardiopsis composta]|uniref:Knr4/Smi1-like domain-containing protein n=1 Tax=Nocardiopsis composta TaxID=157465 RepID=A0A7W8QGW6_9ACTN|nr:SMI1/KNR4 family protein [Nocardiopsis composta]MBB5430126.1 hypothetical protein [Nocardiopsis composta]